MTEKQTARESLTFEEAMGKIEDIVTRLEEGDVPLEKAMTLFQEGMNLAKYCHEKLQKIEKQMDEILTEDGKREPFRFQEDEDS